MFSIGIGFTGNSCCNNGIFPQTLFGIQGNDCGDSSRTCSTDNLCISPDSMMLYGGGQQIQMLQQIQTIIMMMQIMMLMKVMGGDMTGNCSCAQNGMQGIGGQGFPGMNFPGMEYPGQEYIPDGSTPRGRQMESEAKNKIGPASGKLVTVGGAQVDQSIAGNLQAMIDDAKSKGVTLKIVSGFRSHEKQQELYNKYGPSRAAKPGTSNHEKGTAVDFDLSQKGADDYLQKNATRFGFKVNNQVGGWEHWHVSPTGH